MFDLFVFDYRLGSEMVEGGFDGFEGDLGESFGWVDGVFLGKSLEDFCGEIFCWGVVCLSYIVVLVCNWDFFWCRWWMMGIFLIIVMVIYIKKVDLIYNFS